MNFWQGFMNWPIDNEWRCETCGEKSTLTWGAVNGVCRCDNCHTEYAMRNGNTVLSTPMSLVKDEYKDVLRHGWQRYAKPHTQWEEHEWDQAISDARKGAVS